MTPRRRTESLPVPPRPAGRVLDARLHLLDRQVLDADGVPVATVDDVELAGAEVGEPVDPDHPPVVAALLSGSVLLTRIFGGRPPRHRWVRTPWSDVSEIGVVVSLAVRGENLDATWTERWVRDRIVGRIPGGRHAPD